MDQAGGARGGIAILVAFMLLALMTAAAFGTSRNLVRELALAGEAVHGARAAAAAEGGLDWFLAWAPTAGPEPGGGPEAFLANLAQAPGGGVGTPPPLAGGGAGPLLSQPAEGSARQDFSLRIRHLGGWPQPGMGRGGSAGGSADPSAIPQDQLWQVTATGRCRPGGGREFRQIRELLVAAPCADR